ncbi:MAG: MerR family transcriptional regulator [Candidatus Glassbacteria bacterium]|nr:MerR family transcriptional regulator [Candidatus Glassbacteria bacterium]
MQALSNKPLYTIGVASELLGLSPHSLRLYEREGLILPHRTATKRRLYSDVEVAKVKNIHLMVQDKGLNFAAVRHLLSLIPCWKIRADNCVKCRQLNAFLQDGQPCWVTAGKNKRNRDVCRDCRVYLNSTDLGGLKEMIY